MDSVQLKQQVTLAVDELLPVLGQSYEYTVVLGSGLFSFVDRMEDQTSVPYSDIPGLPVSTVKGHASKLIAGRIGRHRVLCFAGRFHYYEGYDTAAVTIPVRIAKALGVHTALFTNAAGGIAERLNLGDLMIIEDHLNMLTADSPLRGLSDDLFGSKFVNMYQAYDPALVELLKSVGKSRSLPIASGVYAALSGPQFETRAEIRMLRTLGADAVGMSTIPEVIVANQMGVRTGAVSVITDLASETTTTLSHEQVLATARRADGFLAELLVGVIETAS
ncbi:MAG: purine-nucleoside phosphorylase [Candidatus Cryosericum sp.]